ncbi:MAG: PIN domain-containing protein [Deltaproteobacteria bacterium]
MTPKTEEITRYDFKSSDELLLDANIWLLVYGPQDPNDPRVGIYSKALKKILAAKSCIYIDVLIVSEFINAYARIKKRVLSPPSTTFKQFRKSSDFEPVAQDIAADVKCVLKHCMRVESGFELLAIDALLDEYAAGNSDFNDQVFISLCSSKGLTLVTDDGDFKGCGIPVITANKRLLT